MADQIKIPYEFAQEFSTVWADLNAIYSTAEKLERRMTGLIKWARHSLDDQDYRVLMLRYAPAAKGGRLSLEEVGNKLGVTKERARQVEAHALKKLGVELFKVDIVYAYAGGKKAGGYNTNSLGRKLKPLPE